MLVLSTLVAHAVPADFQCEQITLTDVLPGPDQEAPAGFRPALVFRGGCGFSFIEAALEQTVAALAR